jgi:SAM-dependent methyltransferase
VSRPADLRRAVAPFERYQQRDDDRFEQHRAAYVSELIAVRALLPWRGRGLEIGVGTGRFAAPLGVEFGIDPAAETLAYARARGVRVACAVAEALPFGQAVFDYAMIVTTICFVADASAMLAQARRSRRCARSSPCAPGAARARSSSSRRAVPDPWSR